MLQLLLGLRLEKRKEEDRNKHKRLSTRRKNPYLVDRFRYKKVYQQIHHNYKVQFALILVEIPAHVQEEGRPTADAVVDASPIHARIAFTIDMSRWTRV
jgi:hypothetical protein